MAKEPLATVRLPVPPTPVFLPTKPTNPAPMEKAYEEFLADRAFDGRRPSREQVARAWSFARFKKEDTNEFPSHAEVVVALKKMFPEFRTSQSKIVSSRSR